MSRSVGAVWTVYQVSKRLGLEHALGKDFQGKLAMWQVIARVINQGLWCIRLSRPILKKIKTFSPLNYHMDF